MEAEVDALMKEVEKSAELGRDGERRVIRFNGSTLWRWFSAGSSAYR